MSYLDESDIRRTSEYLLRYLENDCYKKTNMEIARKLKKYFLNNCLNSDEEFDNDVFHLVQQMENINEECSVIILKNKKELFNIYFFKQEVNFASINLVSSEVFEDSIRRKPVDGCVIEDVSGDNILIFLKAYYLYRKNPVMSPTSQNLVLKYDYNSFEMASTFEKFNNVDPMKVMPLKHIILYDKEALPYSLGYLDSYKDDMLKPKDANLNMHFYRILKDVRRNRFLGMSLRKF